MRETDARFGYETDRWIERGPVCHATGFDYEAADEAEDCRPVYRTAAEQAAFDAEYAANAANSPF